jgi:hypothetical protein
MDSTKPKRVRFAEIPLPTGPRSEIFRKAYERSIAALKELKKMRKDFAEAEKRMIEFRSVFCFQIHRYFVFLKNTNRLQTIIIPIIEFSNTL